MIDKSTVIMFVNQETNRQTEGRTNILQLIVVSFTLGPKFCQLITTISLFNLISNDSIRNTPPIWKDEYGVHIWVVDERQRDCGQGDTKEAQ